MAGAVNRLPQQSPHARAQASARCSASARRAARWPGVFSCRRWAGRARSPTLRRVRASPGAPIVCLQLTPLPAQALLSAPLRHAARKPRARARFIFNGWVTDACRCQRQVRSAGNRPPALRRARHQRVGTACSSLASEARTLAAERALSPAAFSAVVPVGAVHVRVPLGRAAEHRGPGLPGRLTLSRLPARQSPPPMPRAQVLSRMTVNFHNGSVSHALLVVDTDLQVRALAAVAPGPR